MSNFPHIEIGTGDLPGYVASNKASIDQALRTSGAVLLRGFSVPDAQEFDRAVAAYGAENFPYKESLSNAVRINVTDRVFTANEASPDTEIFMHHEMAQTPIYPSKLFFYCEKAAENGGATPLCRSDILFSRMEDECAELAHAFEERGVRYSNVMPGHDDSGSGQGRSWRGTLGVVTANDAEARLSKLGYAWEWQDGETLRVTTPTLSAVRILPDGRKTFFNQLIAAFRGWSDSRNDPARSITFGDGQAITAQDMTKPIELSDEIAYDHTWQAGDVVLVDNFAVMHGRKPFMGTRRVLASLLA